MPLGILLLATGLVLYLRGPTLPKKKKGYVPHKLALKEDLGQLIEMLQNCPPRAEPYICQRLRKLTGLNYDYELQENRAQRKKILGLWTEWWRKSKDLSPQEWLSEAALDPGYPYRPKVILEMGNHPPFPRGIEALLSLVANPSNPVSLRKEGARVLGIWRVKKAGPLFKELLRSSEEPLMIAALFALGKIKEASDETLPFLKHKNSRLREQAAQALFESRPQKAKVHLPPLLSDEELTVRIYALSALKTLVSPEALKGLLKKHVRDPELRKSLEKYE